MPDSEFRVIVFGPIHKNDNSDFLRGMNSENIVQVCLVSSKTHKVNKDLSNSVKKFRVIVFWCRAINDNSECFSKDDFS